MKTSQFKVVLFLLAVAFGSCSPSSHNDPGNTNDLNPSLAVAKLQQAVAAMPDSAGLRYLLMDELLNSNRFEEALHQNDTLLSLDSVNAGLWYKRGVIFLQAADTANCIAALQKAIQRAPMFVEPLLQMAAIYASQLNPEALGIADHIISNTEDTRAISQSTFIKGLYYSNINNKEKAIEQFNDAIKNDYTFLEAYIEKGLLLYDQHNYAEAQAVFERALQVSNTFSEAYYQLGRCREALGNTAEARINYQKALGLDKNFVAAREALERLK